MSPPTPFSTSPSGAPGFDGPFAGKKLGFEVPLPTPVAHSSGHERTPKRRDGLTQTGPELVAPTALTDSRPKRSHRRRTRGIVAMVLIAAAIAILGRAAIRAGFDDSDQTPAYPSSSFPTLTNPAATNPAAASPFTPYPPASYPTSRSSSSPSQNQFASKRCQDCHAFTKMFSHPVDVTPNLSVPSSFPLQDGKVTCTTCHESLEHSGPGKGHMLRSNETEDLVSWCAKCHGGGEGAKVLAHATDQIRAHLQGGSKGPRAGSSAPTAALDSESRACMGCHDGSIASDAGSHASPAALARSELSRGGKQDHPIGINYLSVDVRPSERELVSPSRLDPRIRLFNQTVGCGSCHSVYSQSDHLLVMSNMRSQLCMACHVK